MRTHGVGSSGAYEEIGQTPGESVGTSNYLIRRNMGMGQNLVPLVNIKIAGIYGCSSH